MTADWLLKSVIHFAHSHPAPKFISAPMHTWLSSLVLQYQLNCSLFCVLITDFQERESNWLSTGQDVHPVQSAVAYRVGPCFRGLPLQEGLSKITLYSMGEKTESIYPEVRKRARISTLTTLFSVVLDVLATAIRQQKGIKGNQTG